MLIALAVNVLALLALGYAALFLLAAVRALNTRVETPRARQRRTDAFARRLAATLPAHLPSPTAGAPPARPSVVQPRHGARDLPGAAAARSGARHCPGRLLAPTVTDRELLAAARALVTERIRLGLPALRPPRDNQVLGRNDLR